MDSAKTIDVFRRRMLGSKPKTKKFNRREHRGHKVRPRFIYNIPFTLRPHTRPL